MNLIEGLITLVMLIAFAYGMYLAYQKFVVEGGLFETPASAPVESTQTVQSAPAGEVPGVNSERGRPSSAVVWTGGSGTHANGTRWTLPANPIRWYGGNDKLVANGRAKTASVCYETSKARGANNWGWDRRNKSCFAYLDSNILTAMSDKTNVEGISQYVIGCTEPGVTPKQGCMDFTGGDVVRGNKDWNANTWVNLQRPTSFDQCRKIALDKGYDTLVYGTNLKKWADESTCFGISDPEEYRGFTGEVGNVDYISACTDPSKKVANACV